jgi:hypothetical protein
VNEQEMRDLLGGTDAPRSPRPEFAASLRDQLLAEHSDDDVVVDLETPSRENTPRRGGRWLPAAAALAIVALLTMAIVVRINGNDTTVRTMAPRATVEAACDRLVRSGFGEVPRSQLLGAPDTVLDRPDLPTVVERLRIGLVTFRDDLVRARVDDPSVQQPLQIAISQATLAAQLAEQDVASRVRATLLDVEPRLVELERALTRLGVPTCL